MTTKEPVAYLAWRDGQPSWDEDCVCQDAVYPVDEDDDRTSMPVYTHPAHDDTALLRQALEALHNITKHFGFTRLHKSTLADTTVRGEAHKAITALRERLGEKA